MEIAADNQIIKLNVKHKTIAINTLQGLAIIFMVCDHIGKHFFPEIHLFQIIGRFGMPLWPYFIVFGYKHTHNVKAYKQRLLLVAITSQLPYFYLYGSELNEVFALYLGLEVISNKRNNAILWYIVSIICSYYFGLSMFFINCSIVFYYFKEKYQFIGIVIVILHLCIINHPFQFFSIIGLFLIDETPEIINRIPKFIKFGIYPIHYAIISIIKMVV